MKNSNLETCSHDTLEEFKSENNIKPIFIKTDTFFNKFYNNYIKSF